jgi:glutaredoxin 2
MSKPNLKQFQDESDTWKRLLCLLMDENVRLKYRLAEVLKDKFDKHLLDEVEIFQSRFIKNDGLIGLLRNDVVELDKLLVRERFEDGEIKKKVGTQLSKLRNNIETAEIQFNKLKSEFNSYLLENL